MTILLGCVSCLVALAAGILAAGLAEVAGNRAQAQTAADSAALAAVAESAPYGGADPHALARRYAELNGARVLECRCEPGATAMQVTVSVEGVEARARAVIDPNAIGPLGESAEWLAAGMHPSLRRAVELLTSRSHGSVHVVSGFRSSREQASLWASALQRYGSAEVADDWVAPPGHSMHERGLAVDLGGDLDVAVRLIAELDLPLHRPLANEPWHFELHGSR